MNNIQFRSDCPISSLLDIIGDKWTLLIIRDISIFGKHTFNEFLQSDEKIASNILSDRLAKLVLSKIILKKKHPKSKAKIFYDLSDKGRDLIPILFEIAIWSDKHLKISQEGRLFIESVKKNRKKTLNEIITRLSKDSPCNDR
ncbi:MAG: helix-turn-helix domain-containing protein [Saprospiraceae bacterium]